MPNELLFFIRGLIGLLVLFYVSKLQKEWLYGYIVVNLLIISVLGGKFVEVFGAVSNVGNAFYASVFLATYLLVEGYGTVAAYRSVRIAAAMGGFFVLMTYLTLGMTSTLESWETSSAMHEVLQPNERLAFASIFSFLLSQSLNIWMFNGMRKRLKGKYFWLRANVSNAIAQFIDTVLFFLVAFVGTVPPASLFGAMAAGYVVKVGVVAIGAAFFTKYIGTTTSKKTA